MTRLRHTLAFLLILHTTWPGVSVAETLVVVVNPKSGINTLSREEAVNIFLGRYRQLASGHTAQPVDLPGSQSERASFYRLLVNKEQAEINAYWARLVFSGRTTPPLQAENNEDLIRQVLRNPGGIGYLERSKVDGRVKAVLELTP